MSQRMLSQVCCIVGCSRPASDDDLRHPDEAVCAEHARVSSLVLQGRLRTTLRRRDRLESVWADQGRYDAVVESGRYLKLCDATQAAMDNVDSAWIRLKLEIILSEANRGSRRSDHTAPPRGEAIAS